MSSPAERFSGGMDPASASAMTLLDLWGIVSSRRSFIMKVTLALFTLALVICILGTREYTATGEIQIQKDSSDALGLDSLMGSATANAADALDATVTLQTQAKILESQTLGLQVVQKLNLEKTPDFLPHFSPIGWVMGFLTPKGLPDSRAATLEGSPKRRDRLLSIFKASTKIAPVAGTRLIDISYTSSDPKVAAAAVNELIASLTDYSFQTRYTATAQTSDWLGKQLSDLRVSSEGLQSKVADLQRSSGVFTFGGQDMQGKPTVYSTVLDQLQQSTAALSGAESNRVLKGALYEAAKTGDPEMIAGLSAAASASGSAPAVGTSIVLIQTLRAQEATQKAQFSETAAKFGAAYPKLDDMRANLASVQDSIRAEQGRLLKQTSSDYLVAQQVEQHTRELFNREKQAAEALNDKAIQYEMVRQESDESRALYQRLLSRLKEAGVLEGLRSSNVTVVEPGRVSSRPSKPNVKLMLAGSIFAGLLFGVIGAFGIEVLDDTVHDPKALAREYGDLLIADLPAQTDSAANDTIVGTTHVLAAPGSAYSEAVTGVRTNLLFPRSGASPKVVLITSPGKGEGKSSLAVQLSLLLARQGKRTLLIDGNLRDPSLHSSFGLPNRAGLTTLLGDRAPTLFDEPATQTIASSPLLDVLTSGPHMADPAGLLGSDRMRTELAGWEQRYDFILLDSTAVLSVSDSVVLTTFVDSVLLVACHEVTKAPDLDRAVQLLSSRVGRSAINIVMNSVTHSRGTKRRPQLRAV